VSKFAVVALFALACEEELADVVLEQLLGVDQFVAHFILGLQHLLLLGLVLNRELADVKLLLRFDFNILEFFNIFVFVYFDERVFDERVNVGQVACFFRLLNLIAVVI